MTNQGTIAVLTSGGDAPGMNSAVWAIIKLAAARGIHVLGVRRGFDGLIDGDIEPLTRDLGGPNHLAPVQGLDWLSERIRDDADFADVQATLAELTATTIAAAIDGYAPETREVLVCGGGVHNTDLLRRLGSHLGRAALASTADSGLDPDRVEACAFAWLAMRAVNGEPGNAPGVTGASREAVLGALYSAR